MKLRRLAISLFLALPPFTASQLQAAAAPTENQSGWKKVSNEKVCMVTDMLFAKKQIPIEVKGKTYYGCCENCKERLGKDAEVRKAVDPVSGKAVDKATASIAAGPEGDVAYFENDANMNKFIASRK
ncbi:MAG: TRASH domain-containing protein [Proteobacteria bacterium]|nr:MAG: TRASH domain-containing protein [Pseudomonadota bacterium]